MRPQFTLSRTLGSSCWLYAGAIALLLAPATGLAGKRIEAPVEVPASMHVNVHSNGCTNAGGPMITLTGELAVGGVDGHLIFRNNRKGTHQRTEEVDTSLSILEPGENYSFAKQPPQGGVGGNPHMWLQFYDSAWNAYGAPAYLGRCVQGISAANVDFGMLAHAWTEISGTCANHPGPEITLTGEIALSGMNARMIFSNNMKWTHKRSDTATVDFVLLPAGEAITFAKQPPLGGVGGNPWIWWQFMSDYGDPLSKELYVGRCVQLD